MDAVHTLEGEVRELIRRSGLDPARDEGEVRRLVSEAVADYDERSMSGGMPVLTDVDAASRAVWDTVAGYGPLQQYFDDPSVEEIWVNERLTPGSAVGSAVHSAGHIRGTPACTVRGLSVSGGAFPSLRWRGGRDRRSG